MQIERSLHPKRITSIRTMTAWQMRRMLRSVRGIHQQTRRLWLSVWNTTLWWVDSILNLMNNGKGVGTTMDKTAKNPSGKSHLSSSKWEKLQIHFKERNWCSIKSKLEIFGLTCYVVGRIKFGLSVTDSCNGGRRTAWLQTNHVWSTGPPTSTTLILYQNMKCSIKYNKTCHKRPLLWEDTCFIRAIPCPFKTGFTVHVLSWWNYQGQRMACVILKETVWFVSNARTHTYYYLW